MDELQMVRELFSERRPPSAEVTAAARARLVSRRPTSRRAVLGVGLPVSVITASAAVLIAVATQAPTPELGIYRLPAGAAGARTGTVTAGRQILLTAARTVARATPPATGSYWEIPAVSGNFIMVGPADDRYLILEKTANLQFAARSPRLYGPDIVQALSVQLTSAADRAAWRRAGSPTRWHTYQEDGLALPQGFRPGQLSDIVAGRGEPQVLDSSSGSQPFLIGNHALSPGQLLALPADPARLKKLILSGYYPYRPYPGGVSSFLFQVTPTVLAMPVTPAVRSALYQMLAGLPGVRSAGQVIDAAGNRGVAVSINGRYSHCGGDGLPRPKIVGKTTIKIHGKTFRGTKVQMTWPPTPYSYCVVQQRLVIDPATGLPLAQELRYVKLPAGKTWPGPDGLFSFEIFGTAHWTNTLPATKR